MSIEDKTRTADGAPRIRESSYEEQRGSQVRYCIYDPRNHGKAWYKTDVTVPIRQ